MNIKEMTRIFREDGHYVLYDKLNQEYMDQGHLQIWAKCFIDNGCFFYKPWYPMIQNIIQYHNVERVLDIGVHTGQFSILPWLLANHMGKHVRCCSVSPFDGTSDKYNLYTESNYLDIYMKMLRDMKLPQEDFIRLRGLSQDERIIDYLTRREMKFDLIFLDGSHDYDVIVEDIKFYVLTRIKKHGIIIISDACYFENPVSESHRQGHADVIKAVNELMDDNDKFEHLFNLTHLRVFRAKGE